jgi:hypothetical protein
MRTFSIAILDVGFLSMSRAFYDILLCNSHIDSAPKPFPENNKRQSIQATKARLIY